MYQDVSMSKEELEKKLDKIADYWYDKKFSKLNKVQRRMIFRGDPANISSIKIYHNTVWENYEDSVYPVPLFDVIDTVDVSHDVMDRTWYDLGGFYHRVNTYVPMIISVRAAEVIKKYRKLRTTEYSINDAEMKPICKSLYTRKNCEILPLKYQYVQPQYGHLNHPRNHLVFTVEDSIILIRAESLAIIWKMTGQQNITLYLSRQVGYIRQKESYDDIVIVRNNEYDIGALNIIDDDSLRDKAAEYLSNTNNTTS